MANLIFTFGAEILAWTFLKGFFCSRGAEFPWVRYWSRRGSISKPENEINRYETSCFRQISQVSDIFFFMFFLEFSYCAVIVTVLIEFYFIIIRLIEISRLFELKIKILLITTFLFLLAKRLSPAWLNMSRSSWMGNNFESSFSV